MMNDTLVQLPPVIDTHAHLQLLPDWPSQADSWMQKIADAEVKALICIATDEASSRQVCDIANTWHGVAAAVGIHPLHTTDCIKPDRGIVADLQPLAQLEKVVAIGETGLDAFHESDFQLQQQFFAAHIQLARQVKKPLVIHTRKAVDQTIDMMQAEKAWEVGGILHCFTEDLQMAKNAIDMGFYISFSGIISFKNAEYLREIAKSLPIASLLIETDSPYLAPVPYRGKVNHPGLVQHVLQALADCLAMDIVDLAKQLEQNVNRLFEWPDTGTIQQGMRKSH